VTWPTSPHSEKKIAANETIAALLAVWFLSFAVGWSGFRQSAKATPRKLIAVMLATKIGGSREIAWPTRTATAIFAMKAAAIPKVIGSVRYRAARTPVVYRSLSPTISATNTVPNVVKKMSTITDRDSYSFGITEEALAF
jgi:hypothetical protein